MELTHLNQINSPLLKKKNASLVTVNGSPLKLIPGPIIHTHHISEDPGHVPKQNLVVPLVIKKPSIENGFHSILPSQAMSLSSNNANSPNNNNNNNNKIQKPARSIPGGILNDDIAFIANELEKNLEKISNSNGLHDYSNEALQIYNFAFNKLILFEKSINTEKAYLLRKIQQFYLQLTDHQDSLSFRLIKDPSLLYDQLDFNENKIENYAQENQLLKSKIKELETDVSNLMNINSKLQTEVSQKDCIISANTFELDFANSQNITLKMELNRKKEKMKKLKNAIIERDVENKKELAEIECLSKEINTLHSGDVGFVYKNQLLQNQLVQDQRKIIELTEKMNSAHKNEEVSPKVEVGIETDPVQIKKKNWSKKKLQLKKNAPFDLGSQPKQRILSADGLPSVSLSLKNFPIGSISKLDPKPSPKPSPKSNSDIPEELVGKTIINQNICNQIENLPPIYINIPFPNQNKTIIPQEKNDQQTQTENNNNFDKLIFFESSDLDQGDDQEPHEVIESFEKNLISLEYEEDLINLPKITNFHKDIIPLFANTTSRTFTYSLKIFTLKSKLADTFSEKTKPMIWGIELIHNYLMENDVRSIEIESLTEEGIFSKWIKAKFPLKYIYEHVIIDFSAFLMNYHCSHWLVSLFEKILQGNYSRVQVCFLSIIYSLSLPYLRPSLLFQLNNHEIPSTNKIHVLTLNQLLLKCVGPEFANSFLLPYVRDGVKMLSFPDFLIEIVQFFEIKHKQIITQSKILLNLCGSFLYNSISEKVLSSFFSIIDYPMTKKEIKNLIFNYNNTSNKDPCQETNLNTITIENLLCFCAEKKQPLVAIAKMETLETSEMILKDLNSLYLDIYNIFMNKFTNTIPSINQRLTNFKISPETKEKINFIINQVRISLLKVDFKSFLWWYKMFLYKIETITLFKINQIPFSFNSNPENIQRLLDYFNFSEKTSLSFLE